MNPWLEGLNSEQLAAVVSDARTKYVIAGPGSGKTRTLTAAVACAAAELGTHQIVALTFTVAAATELEQRLAAVGMKGKLGFVGTLHAFCFRLLRGLDPHLTALDEQQAKDMAIAVLLDLGLLRKVKPEAVLRCPLVSGYAARTPEEIAAYEFRARCLMGHVISFDNMLREACALSRQIQWSWTALFVDEAQDASRGQWDCYNTFPFARRFIVGDPDQGIFSWNGADTNKLVEQARNSAMFCLGNNYRSGANVCCVANRLIENNKGRIFKMTHPVGDRWDRVDVVGHDAPIGELTFAAEWVKAKTPPEACAILTRTNAQAEVISEHLAALGIPVAREEGPARPTDWARTLALLRVLECPTNDWAMLNYLSFTEQPEHVQQLREKATISMKPVAELVGWNRVPGVSGLDIDMLQENVSVSAREMVHQGCRELGAKGEWTLGELILYLASGERHRKLTGGVTVCTVHSAKGREWDNVMVAGFEEGWFPTLRKDTDIEEERRIAFVAFTRARHRLVLSWCSSRPGNRGPNLPPGPAEERQQSRFIKEAGL